MTKRPKGRNHPSRPRTNSSWEALTVHERLALRLARERARRLEELGEEGKQEAERSRQEYMQLHRDAARGAKEKENRRRAGQAKRGVTKGRRELVRGAFEELRDARWSRGTYWVKNRTEAYRRLARESERRWGMRLSLSTVRNYCHDLPWRPTASRHHAS